MRALGQGPPSPKMLTRHYFLYLQAAMFQSCSKRRINTRHNHARTNPTQAGTHTRVELASCLGTSKCGPTVSQSEKSYPVTRSMTTLRSINPKPYQKARTTNPKPQAKAGTLNPKTLREGKKHVFNLPATSISVHHLANSQSFHVWLQPVGLGFRV